MKAVKRNQTPLAEEETNLTQGLDDDELEEPCFNEIDKLE